MAARRKYSDLIEIEGRLAWTSLVEPDQYGKFSAQVIFPTDSSVAAVLRRAFKQLVVAKWGADKKMAELDHVPIKVGNELIASKDKAEDKAELSMYADKLYLRASTTFEIAAFDAEGEDCDLSKFYCGCKALMGVKFSPYSFTDDKTRQVKEGISAYLQSVTFLADDEHFTKQEEYMAGKDEGEAAPVTKEPEARLDNKPKFEVNPETGALDEVAPAAPEAIPFDDDELPF